MLESPGSRPRPLGGAVVLVIAALSSAGYVACGADEGADFSPIALSGSDASLDVGGGRAGQTGGSGGRGGASTGGRGGTSTGGSAQADGSVDAATDSSVDASDDAPMSNGL